MYYIFTYSSDTYLCWDVCGVTCLMILVRVPWYQGPVLAEYWVPVLCVLYTCLPVLYTHITVGEIMNIFTWGGGGQSCQRILEGDDDSILTQQCNKHTLNTSSVGIKTCFLICRWLQMMQNLLLSWVPGQMFDVCEVSYLGLVQKLRKYRRYKLIELMKLSKSRVNWVSILTQYMYSPLGKPSKKKKCGFCPH